MGPLRQVGALWFGPDGSHAPGHSAHCGAHRWLEGYRGGPEFGTSDVLKMD